jgi:hypothetical protein
MKPKIISWNVKGLNEGDKRMRVRNLLRHWKVDIVAYNPTSKIRLWNDVWCGNSSLKEAFPGLYNMVTSKDASIMANLDFSSSSL